MCMGSKKSLSVIAELPNKQSEFSRPARRTANPLRCLSAVQPTPLANAQVGSSGIIVMFGACWMRYRVSHQLRQLQRRSDNPVEITSRLIRWKRCSQAL